MNYRELRRGMIVLVNTIDKLQNNLQKETGRTSRELSLVRTNLQTTMMWTGTFMKFAKLGDNPYAKHDGNRTEVKDIEPMFDATEETFNQEILDKGLIYSVDQMREYLQKQLDSLMQDKESLIKEFESEEQEMHLALCYTNIYKHLTESRMWLGMELGRIREESK